MTTLNYSFMDLENESQAFAVECFVLSQPRSQALDKVVVCMGLESATALRSEISTEGVIDWIHTRIKKLGRKISIVVNKLIAKLTGASKHTKALIEKAKTDDSIRLPISGKRVAALVGVTTVTIAAMAGAVTFDYRRGSNAEKMLNRCEETLKRYEEDIEYKDFGTSAQGRAHKINMKLKADMGRSSIKRQREMLKDGNPAYTGLKKLFEQFAKMKSVLAKFGTNFRKLEVTAAQAKVKDEHTVGFFGRLKDLGFFFVRVISLLRKWFRFIPAFIKGKHKDLNLPVVYQNLRPYGG